MQIDKKQEAMDLWLLIHVEQGDLTGLEPDQNGFARSILPDLAESIKVLEDTHKMTVHQRCILGLPVIPGTARPFQHFFAVG